MGLGENQTWEQLVFWDFIPIPTTHTRQSKTLSWFSAPLPTIKRHLHPDGVSCTRTTLFLSLYLAGKEDLERQSEELSKLCSDTPGKSSSCSFLTNMQDTPPLSFLWCTVKVQYWPGKIVSCQRDWRVFAATQVELLGPWWLLRATGTLL